MTSTWITVTWLKSNSSSAHDKQQSQRFYKAFGSLKTFPRSLQGFWCNRNLYLCTALRSLPVPCWVPSPVAWLGTVSALGPGDRSRPLLAIWDAAVWRRSSNAEQQRAVQRRLDAGWLEVRKQRNKNQTIWSELFSEKSQLQEGLYQWPLLRLLCCPHWRADRRAVLGTQIKLSVLWNCFWLQRRSWLALFSILTSASALEMAAVHTVQRVVLISKDEKD